MGHPRDAQLADIRSLLDLEEVRQLAARYVACIDRGRRPDAFDPEGFDSVFAADATYDMPDLGIRVGGLEAIKASLVEETRHVDFSHHSLTDPVILIRSSRFVVTPRAAIGSCGSFRSGAAWCVSSSAGCAWSADAR